jgi:predicted dehydrogenase
MIPCFLDLKTWTLVLGRHHSLRSMDHYTRQQDDRRPWRDFLGAGCLSLHTWHMHRYAFALTDKPPFVILRQPTSESDAVWDE